MKLRTILQRLMALLAVLLLIVCFATGAAVETENSSVQPFLWMLTLMVCIGTVGLFISGAQKPLGWVVVGSFIGSAICLCELLGPRDMLFAPKLFFTLFLLEFLLSALYGILKRQHFID